MKAFIKKITAFTATFIGVLAFGAVPAMAEENSGGHIPEADATVIVAPDVPPGSTLYLDVEKNEITRVELPSNSRIVVSRGCTESGAACWAGGNPGDLQFSGLGAINGNWPNRYGFYSGTLHADVGYYALGSNRYVSNISPYTRMEATMTMTGIYVYRY